MLKRIHSILVDVAACHTSRNLRLYWQVFMAKALGPEGLVSLLAVCTYTAKGWNDDLHAFQLPLCLPILKSGNPSQCSIQKCDAMGKCDGCL